MKVDLVIGSLDVGGAEKQIAGLAMALNRLGNDATVVTLFSDGRLADTLAKAGLRHVSLASGRQRNSGVLRRGGRLPALVLSLVRRWSRSRPDAVQAWLPEAQIVALPVARLVGIPVRVLALRSQSSAVNLSRSSWRALEVAARSSTDAVGNAWAVANDPGWRLGKLRRHVIANAVDVPVAAADPSREPARGVMVANLNPHKGQLALVEALARARTGPQVNLVGSGPMRAQLDAAILARGLTDRMTIIEGVSDPTPYLLDSQFFVLSSPSEGLPNAALEAMAAGLPVIAFAVGGIPEIIDDGVSGLLVKPGDIDGLAAAIDRAVLDPGWRARAGREARERVQQLTWESRALENLAVMSAHGD